MIKLHQFLAMEIWFKERLLSKGFITSKGADLEVAFRKSTCYIRDLKGNDILTGSYGTNLYSISLQDSTTPNLICLMAKATSSQAWLWHLSTEVHQAAETVTTSNELDLLFCNEIPLFDEYFNGENQVVLKSSAVTTTDASNKRQQQPDSTSSTSTLATTVTANGNFDL
ncbi:hypothetical protein Tco_0468895 [Tanacetum coccineum]